jgi:hypothetical protein
MKKLTTLNATAKLHVLSNQQMFHVRGGNGNGPEGNNSQGDDQDTTEGTDDDKRRARPGGGVTTS